jgi:hypothetical protein
MTSGSDEQERAGSPQLNSEDGNNKDAEAQGRPSVTDIEVTDIEPGDQESLGQGREPEPGDPFEENVRAVGRPVVAQPLPKTPFKQWFQNRSLWVIAGLIVFFALATLGTAVGAAFIPDEHDAARNTVIALASDIAKSAIPTLIALLGTAAAWAFKDSEKD